MIRRQFLLGIAAVLTAPAIVHAGNLMPVSSRMLYDRRFLIDYIIGTDTFAMRADVAQFTMPRPGRSSSCHTLTEAQALKLFPDARWKSLKPGPHEQFNVSYHLDAERLREISLREFDGTILESAHPIFRLG